MKRCFKLALLALLLTDLTACSTIKSWFPDKQKEYRYSTEIPPLEIPPDLIGSTPGQTGVIDDDNTPPEPKAKSSSAAAPSPELKGKAAANGAPRSDSNMQDSPIGKYRPAAPGAEESAVIAKDNNGAHILIETPFANAWTITEKAINRLRIEIKDKDRSQKLFYVYYSENAKPFEPSWSDDLLSPFRGSKHRDDEREYRVQLDEAGDVLTKIRVKDSAGQFQSQGEGYLLLQSIQQNILLLSKPEPEKFTGFGLFGSKSKYPESDDDDAP